MVIAWPMALCGLSGATTMTRPNAFISSTSAWMPGAWMPSSFVTRINRSFCMGGKAIPCGMCSPYRAYVDLCPPDQPMKKPIFPPDAAKPLAPYTPAIDTGDLVFLSGQIALTPQGEVRTENIEDETRQVMENL